MTFVFCHFYFVFYLWTVNVKSWRVFEWLMGVVVFYARFPPHREQLWTTSPVMLCCADVFRIRADSWAALRVTRVGETLYLNQIIFLYISLTIIHWFIKWLRNSRLLLKADINQCFHLVYRLCQWFVHVIRVISVFPLWFYPHFISNFTSVILTLVIYRVLVHVFDDLHQYQFLFCCCRSPHGSSLEAAGSRSGSESGQRSGHRSPSSWSGEVGGER